MDYTPPIHYKCDICAPALEQLSQPAQGLWFIICNQDEPLDFLEYLLHVEPDNIFYEPFKELEESGWFE